MAAGTSSSNPEDSLDSSLESFDLEKRSVLYKSWLYTTHSSRFKKAGDYFSFSIAGLNIFLIKNKTGDINAFHNVCRHRAYPVVKKEQGSSIILGCKYHGWSYNSDGKLTKAPQFDDVPGFDKSQNSLYKINTHVTEQGLVFINFDSRLSDTSPKFDDKFEASLGQIDFSDHEFYSSFELDGSFNWKFEVAQLPEGITKASTFDEDTTLKGTDFYLFPTSRISSLSSAWYSMRVLPISASRTILQFDIYKKKGTNQDDIDTVTQQIKLSEKKKFDQLCTKALSNEAELESTVNESRIQEMIEEHLENEKNSGLKVNPAFVGSKSASETGQMLDKICQDLECGSIPDPVLAW